MICMNYCNHCIHLHMWRDLEFILVSFVLHCHKCNSAGLTSCSQLTAAVKERKQALTIYLQEKKMHRLGHNFGGVVAMITVEIAVIYFLIYLRHRYRPTQVNRPEKSFSEMVGTHLLSDKSWCNIMLACTRIGSFLYFLILSWIINWDLWGAENQYNYFTHWNLVLICIYFFCVSICSIIYLVTMFGYMDRPKIDHPLKDFPLVFGPSNFFERFAQNCARVSDVAGCCALFVTVVNFGVLDSSTEKWNVVNHLTNTIFMSFELLNNNIEASMESYKWVVTWIWVYIIFTWSLVSSDTKPWPYFFLDTSSGPGAYAWYEGLLILNFVFFIIWFYASRLKFVIAARFNLITFNWTSVVTAADDSVEVGKIRKVPEL